MHLSRNNLVGSAILNPDRESAFGTIKVIIVDPDSGKVLAVSLDRSIDKVISFVDLKWDDELRTFYVLNDDVVCSRSEIIRVDKLVSEGSFLNKQKVVTESGKNLGKLYDFYFEPELAVMSKIVTKKRFIFFSDTLVIAHNNILEVDSSFIKVRDNAAHAFDPKYKFKKKAEPAISGTAFSK